MVHKLRLSAYSHWLLLVGYNAAANMTAAIEWIELPVEWHEYHDGLIGLRRKNPDGSYFLVVLDHSSSLTFKLMLERTFLCAIQP